MQPVCFPHQIFLIYKRQRVADFDITGSFLEPCTWCVIELTSGVISVCLPTFWPLLVHASKTYTKYMPSRFSSKSKLMSNPEPNRALVTIGGGMPNWNNGCKNSIEKSGDVLALTSEVTQTGKLSTSSHDDALSDSSHNERSKPEFRV